MLLTNDEIIALYPFCNKCRKVHRVDVDCGMRPLFCVGKRTYEERAIQLNGQLIPFLQSLGFHAYQHEIGGVDYGMKGNSVNMGYLKVSASHERISEGTIFVPKGFRRKE